MIPSDYEERIEEDYNKMFLFSSREIELFGLVKGEIDYKKSVDEIAYDNIDCLLPIYSDGNSLYPDQLPEERKDKLWTKTKFPDLSTVDCVEIHFDK